MQTETSDYTAETMDEILAADDRERRRNQSPAEDSLESREVRRVIHGPYAGLASDDMPAVRASQVQRAGGDTWVELVIVHDADCVGCGQPITVDGPVAWIGQLSGCLVRQGGHSHQHGCGGWNTPDSVIVETSDDEDSEVIADRLIAAARGLLEAM